MNSEHPGRRLGSLSFRSEHSRFIYMLHEGDLQNSMIFTGYAAPLHCEDAMRLTCFTATLAGIPLERIRTPLHERRQFWMVSLPSNPFFPDSGEERHRIYLASSSMLAPYTAEDGASPDSAMFRVLADGATLGDAQLLSFTKGFPFVTTFAISACVIMTVSAALIAYNHFADAEDNRHEEGDAKARNH